MVYVNYSSSHCSVQGNSGIVPKVITMAMEASMWLLLNLKLHVTICMTSHLISLALQINFVSVGYTSGDVHLKYLTLNLGFLTFAAPTSVLVSDHLAFSLAIWTHRLESLYHRSHLAHHGLHALTIAARTCFDRTSFSSLAITFWTFDRPL